MERVASPNNEESNWKRHRNDNSGDLGRPTRSLDEIIEDGTADATVFLLPSEHSSGLVSAKYDAEMDFERYKRRDMGGAGNVSRKERTGFGGRAWKAFRSVGLVFLGVVVGGSLARSWSELLSYGTTCDILG